MIQQLNQIQRVFPLTVKLIDIVGENIGIVKLVWSMVAN